MSRTLLSLALVLAAAAPVRAAGKPMDTTKVPVERLGPRIDALRAKVVGMSGRPVKWRELKQVTAELKALKQTLDATLAAEMPSAKAEQELGGALRSLLDAHHQIKMPAARGVVIAQRWQVLGPRTRLMANAASELVAVHNELAALAEKKFLTSVQRLAFKVPNHASSGILGLKNHEIDDILDRATMRGVTLDPRLRWQVKAGAPRTGGRRLTLEEVGASRAIDGDSYQALSNAQVLARAGLPVGVAEDILNETVEPREDGTYRIAPGSLFSPRSQAFVWGLNNLGGIGSGVSPKGVAALFRSELPRILRDMTSDADREVVRTWFEQKIENLEKD